MKKILVILILAANVFADDQPVRLAARTVVREGKLEFGVRNNTRSNVAGVIKFDEADGMELLANGFGFELGPKKTVYKSIPIRNTTKDLPLLICDVIIFNNAKSRLYKNKVQCKSGALFRDIGVGEMTSYPLKTQKIEIHRGKGGGKNFLSFYLQKECLVKYLNCGFGAFQIDWNKANSKNGMELVGKAVKGFSGYNGSNAIANVKLSIKQNGRGDCMVVFNYFLLKQLPDTAIAPQISMIIPRRLARNDLAALKFKNQRTELIVLDDARDLVDKNKDIEEFSIVTKNDWMTFYLDSSYLKMWNILPKTTPDKRAGSVRMVIKSRTEWKPPFVPKRSGTIQFLIHLPVAVPYLFND